MYQVVFANGQKAQVEPDGKGWRVNGQYYEPAAVPLPGGGQHLLLASRGYTLHTLAAQGQQLTLGLNGQPHTLQVHSPTQQLLQRLGMGSQATAGGSSLKAPMPGLVLRQLVQPGDAVEKGSPLLVLEAMKMENVLKASTAGTVKNIAVQPGQKVEKGTLLIEFE